MIPYGRQDINQQDINAVVEVLKSDFLTQGPQVPAFEQSIIDACDAKYAVAVNSATSALHIACLALGLGNDDWLWTTPNTFVASANCALYCGAKVDFVDIDPRTHNLCAKQLEKKLLKILDESITLLDRFFLPGSIIGLGTLFYLAILLSLHSRKHLIHYAVILLFVFQLGGFFHPFGEITFINVGQGDSIFIKMPLSHEGMLIDTGKPGQYRTVTAYLKAKGIWKLDTMAITHGDNDHSGSMEQLNQAYHVRQLIQVHQKKITYGLYDFYDLNEITDEDENRSSLVLYTKINGMRILFMADADEVTEKEIARKYGNLRCDVLKLSHHGSKTGSCDRFLDTVRPGLGIISSGPYRIYHHPSPETIQRLLKRHIPYLDTKKEGDITILTLPHMNLCISAAGSLGIINTQ